MGRIAQQIAGSRAQGSLPSAIVQNPRNHENDNVLTIVSQRVAKDEEKKETKDGHVIEVDLEVRENKKKQGPSDLPH